MDQDRPWWPWLRAPLLSIIGLGCTHFLIGLGVPLDRWARSAGEWVSIKMTLDQAAWGASVVAASLMLVAGAYWPSIKTLIQKLFARREVTANEDWLKDAVYFLVHDRWPERGDILCAPPSLPQSEVEKHALVDASAQILRNIRQRAYDGLYVVRGKPYRSMTIQGDVSRHGVLDAIPQNHWREYEVSPHELVNDPSHMTTTRSANLPDDGSFVALRVNRSQTEQLKTLLRTNPVTGEKYVPR